MPRRRITISDWDENEPPRRKRQPSGPVSIWLLVIIVFAVYGMGECYRQHPPKIFHPQTIPQR